MRVKVLGAAREVGRSAFLVTHGNSSVVLDYGALTTRQPDFPLHVQPKKVNGLILSHAHLDHSGSAPMFFLGDKLKLHCTPVTSELSTLLVDDFIKISGSSGAFLPFESFDLQRMNDNTTMHGYRETFEVGEFKVTLYDAGHIPGSAIVALEAGNKRLLYTGDMNGSETELLAPLSPDIGDSDLVITESTYATADHPERVGVERAFVDFANTVVERGGVLLAPAFSVGRAQELAMVLHRNGFKHTIGMDGMALKVNAILMRHQEYVKDPTEFRRTLESLEFITDWGHRRNIVKKPSVIIAPAGMLVGGASIFYNQQLALGEKNGVAIVSFQVPGTPGRTLIDKGMTMINGRAVKVRAEVRRFDFSSHSGRSTLEANLKAFKGSPRFMTVHGEEESCVTLAEKLHRELGVETYAPRAGEEYEV